MASAGISTGGFLLRLVVATVLVFATYNPSGWSYLHWLRDHYTEPGPLIVLAGLVLVIGWTIYLRATLRSLGPFGLVLALGFFATLIWLVVDVGLVPADNVTAITYIVEAVLCAVLATGVSWSHVRRRITGQADVDEIED